MARLFRVCLIAAILGASGASANDKTVSYVWHSPYYGDVQREGPQTNDPCADVFGDNADINNIGAGFTVSWNGSAGVCSCTGPLGGGVCSGDDDKAAMSGNARKLQSTIEILDEDDERGQD